MKNKSGLFIKFLILFTLFLHGCKKVDANIMVLSDSSSMTEIGFDFLPKATTNQIVKHQFYTLSYVEKQEQAEWVAYELRAENLDNHHYKRPFFIEDNLVATGSADWRNYKKSGYDKGHLCPAADMQFDKNAFEDTFFTSNISPQLHDFNDGIWNTLEQKVRYWASKYNKIYVVTGPVFSANMKTIGTENVAVPQSYYKVLLRKSGNDFKMIAFLVPAVDSNLPLYKFVISPDKLEQITGLDFYPKLDDAIENDLEKNSDYKDWSF